MAFDVEAWKRERQQRIDFGLVSLMWHNAKASENNFVIPAGLRWRLTPEAMKEFGLTGFNTGDRRMGSAVLKKTCNIQKIVKLLEAA